MPTPTYALRLPRETQDAIAEMSRIYGAPNPRAFAREILETMCSGDPERVKAFNRRLMAGVGEQLALKLNAAIDATTSEREPRTPRTPRIARKPRKKRRGRERST